MSGESQTCVVNVNSKSLRSMGYQSLEQWLEDPNHVYIGRANGYVPGAFQSKWHNPFKCRDDSQREECVRSFHQYILQQPQLLAALPELRTKQLGCWCKPKRCHGDVLVQLVQQMCRKEREAKAAAARSDTGAGAARDTRNTDTRTGTQ